MNYQPFVDKCATACCIISVQQTKNRAIGDVRIACANDAYKTLMGPAYYDDMPYDELVPHEPKFEDFCFRSAIMGQRIHEYVEVAELGQWVDYTLIPLVSDRDDLGYCQFLLEHTQNVEPSHMASVSADTAAAAIKASITLMGSADIRESVKEILDDLLIRTEGFSTRITLVDDEHQEAVIFCEAFCKGAFTDVNLGDALVPYETVKSWEAMIGQSNLLIVKDEADYAEIERFNPEWVASMKSYNVNSIVLIPLKRNQSVIGYLHVTNFNVDRVVEVKELVQIMAFFLGSEISNYLLMKQLEILSSVDGLTGAFNRHAMINRMKQITDDADHPPFGVINMDLNGLKAANDNSGHDAGDQLLIEASEILKKVFHEDDLFRTGGDEFIVICPDIEQDVFNRKVERLRSDVAKNARVSFAIGAFWSNGSTDVHTALINADEEMYADKRAFYAAHPELQRRFI